MAIWRRGKPDALLHHSDRGSQGGFKWSSQRLMRSDDDEVEAAIGSFRESSIALAGSTASGRAE
jgi:transposase InsO family protein